MLCPGEGFPEEYDIHSQLSSEVPYDVLPTSTIHSDSGVHLISKAIFLLPCTCSYYSVMEILFLSLLPPFFPPFIPPFLPLFESPIIIFKKEKRQQTKFSDKCWILGIIYLWNTHMESQTAPQDSLPREELIMTASVVGGLIFLEDFLRNPAPPQLWLLQAAGRWEVL